MKLNGLTINKEKGILIVYEGISGCGKSQSVEKLFSHLDKKGYKTSVLEWNTNRVLRKIVEKLQSKQILNSNIYSFIQWIGFFIDYFTKIIPLLKKEYIVIADRYIYTALTRDRANGAAKDLSCFVNFFRREDLLFYYDIPPDICYERIKIRGKALCHTNDRILNNKLLKNKDLYYLNKLRNHYVNLLSNPQVIKETNVIFIKDNNIDTNAIVDCYINKKLNSSYNKKFDILKV